MEKSLYIIIIMLFATGASFAQSSAMATVSATITNPVGTGKLDDMDFGSFKTTSAAGTIQLNNSKPKISGGVKLENTGTASLASINITGDYEYAVTLPSSDIVLKRKGGNETMTVESFYITPADKGLLAIGATLKVGASQLPGRYSSVTPLDVTVNYN